MLDFTTTCHRDHMIGLDVLGGNRIEQQKKKEAAINMITC